MLPVGTVLNGKYRIDRYLASGGFGNTYAAYNLFLEEEVAVKEFYIRGVTQRDGDSVSVSVSNEENLTQFIDQKTKFMKEARRLRRLKNDHIVRVHDLFEENGTAYYIMDFVNGESLSSRLKRTGQPIGEQESLNILGQVLDALAVVHQQGIFHLDIKPANIMVDHEGNALLIDFGASKQIKQEGGATTSTGLCYTPGYAPIEQMTQNFNQFGPWTDIYSLGASLYYMLTLHPLPSPADLLENEILLQMDDTVSPRTQQIVRRMMAPVRTKRPQSVAEVKCLLAEKIVDDPTQIVTKSEPPSEITRTIAKPQPQPVPPLPKPQPQPTAPHTLSEKAMSPVGGSPGSIKPPLPKPQPQPTAPHTLSEKTMSPVGGPPGATKPPQPKPAPNPQPVYEPQPSPGSSSKMWLGIGVGIAAAVVAAIVLTHFLLKGPSIESAPAYYIEQATVNSKPRADETITVNGVSFKMIGVQGGTFTMGATSEQGSEANDDEKPAHQVTLSSYSIGETEVTQELWQAVMGDNPSEFKGARRPVETVSWEDCKDFIRELNNLTGRRFRLPTEAEWEYAARGGKKSKGYRYSGSNSIGDVAWYRDNSGNQTHDVGTKRANELGLYDMSGNVLEWCQDWYDSYISSSQTNPTGASGENPVLRGGSWKSITGHCRVSRRIDFPSIDFNFLGLRLAE